MRLLVDLRSHVAGAPLITQVEKTPVPGDLTPINGKYVLPMVEDFTIDDASYILDGTGALDGLDVVSQSFAHLLAAYPMFEFIYFNPLLTADHITDLDLTSTFTDPLTGDVYPVRAQTGREPMLPYDAGQMPTHTALLPLNDTMTPTRPGLLISKEIDLSAYTGAAGADQFVLYWKLYDFDVQHDIASDYGITAGQNDPAVRHVLEANQEPSGFSVYISPDNGAHWCSVGLMEPVAFCQATTSIRVAFMNTGSTKKYLAAYAVMF